MPKASLSLSRMHLKWNYENVLCLVFALFFFFSLISITEISFLSINRFIIYVRFGTYGLLGLCALFTAAGRKMGSLKEMWEEMVDFFCHHLLYVLFTLCTLLIAIQSRAIEPFVIAVALLACYQINFKKLFLVIFATFVFFLLMTVGLALLHVIPNVPYIREVPIEGTREVRYAFGFIYPLELECFLFFILLLFFYLFRDKISWWMLALIIAGTLVSYKLTKARFTTVLILLACVLFFLWRYRRLFGSWIEKIKPGFFEDEQRNVRRRKILSWVLVILFMAGLTLLFYIIGTHTFWKSNMAWFTQKLNRLFNNRLSLGRGAYADYGFRAFGQYINWIGFGGIHGESATEAIEKVYNFVDVSYFKNLLDYGYVWMVFILGFYLSLWMKSFQKGNWIITLVLTMILLEGLFEPRLSQIAINPFILLAFQSVFMENGLVYQGLERVELYG